MMEVQDGSTRQQRKGLRQGFGKAANDCARVYRLQSCVGRKMGFK